MTIFCNWASESEGERERGHLVVQLGRAVCIIYICIYPVRAKKFFGTTLYLVIFSNLSEGQLRTHPFGT